MATMASPDCATVHFDTTGMTDEERESVAAYEAFIGLRDGDEELQAAFERAGKLEPTFRGRRLAG